MRKVLAALAVVIVIVAAIVLWRTRAEKHAAATAATPTPKPAASDRPTAPPAHVKRLAPAARKQLGDQIETARAKARAAASQAASTSTPTGSAPALPPTDQIQLDDVSKSLQDTFREAIPILAECYGAQASGATATAQMTLSTDPELGTVIDTDALTDDKNQPLDPKIDACLRDAVDSLGLPPLADHPGFVKVQYSFKFD